MKESDAKKTLTRVLFLVFIFFIALCSLGWAASGGDEHGGAHGNRWLDIDTWKVLNFAVLVIAGFFIARKPVAQFFSSRANGIRDEIKELEKKKAAAEKQLAEYQAMFKNLDQESKKIVDDYINQGEEAKKRILAEAEAQAEKLESLAKRNIEQEFKAAKAKLQQEIAEQAVEKAEQMIKASISSEDQDKLVDDYLRKVVA